nr:accessory colonization factor [Vibrio anguillarum]
MKFHLVITTMTISLTSMTVLASPQLDPKIKHQPKDGIINIYGPGGPDSALRHAANAFSQQN